MKGHGNQKKKGIFSAACVAIVFVVGFMLVFPWIFSMSQQKSQLAQQNNVLTGVQNIDPKVIAELTAQIAAKLNLNKETDNKPKVTDSSSNNLRVVDIPPKTTLRKPVLGEIPTNGVQPLFGIKHQGGDAVFALAANYDVRSYKRFVGSLRKAGYLGDIVLAVTTEDKMKPGVADYLKKMNVVAYGFDVDCKGHDNCKLKDDFLGYPDPRPYRTFANIRYALYEYWMRYYNEKSYILILDFRDTFFQRNPFEHLGPVESRTPKYELRLFAENGKVKWIGNCVWNSMWVGKCFGEAALEPLKKELVICSGSTFGSFEAMHHYIPTMLRSMDEVKCWLKNIESDQGYQNYLFYNHKFDSPDGKTKAVLYKQGEDIVNTIGALNGARVPEKMKGPLDTHWKIRDKNGYILNNDGTRSFTVHQWDRWEGELIQFVDSKLYE